MLVTQKWEEWDYFYLLQEVFGVYVKFQYKLRGYIAVKYRSTSQNNKEFDDFLHNFDNFLNNVG